MAKRPPTAMNLKLPMASHAEDTFTETASVVAKKNDDGQKYINQYMIVKELGRYLRCLERIIGGATAWSNCASTPSCTARLP